MINTSGHPVKMQTKDAVRCGVLAVSTLALGCVALSWRVPNVGAVCTPRCNIRGCEGASGQIAHITCRDCSFIDESCCDEVGIRFGCTFMCRPGGRGGGACTCSYDSGIMQDAIFCSD
jgi:hypothetical protein